MLKCVIDSDGVKHALEKKTVCVLGKKYTLTQSDLRMQGLLYTTRNFCSNKKEKIPIYLNPNFSVMRYSSGKLTAVSRSLNMRCFCPFLFQFYNL